MVLPFSVVVERIGGCLISINIIQQLLGIVAKSEGC